MQTLGNPNSLRSINPKASGMNLRATLNDRIKEYSIILYDDLEVDSGCGDGLARAKEDVSVDWLRGVGRGTTDDVGVTEGVEDVNDSIRIDVPMAADIFTSISGLLEELEGIVWVLEAVWSRKRWRRSRARKDCHESTLLVGKLWPYRDLAANNNPGFIKSHHFIKEVRLMGSASIVRGVQAICNNSIRIHIVIRQLT